VELEIASDGKGIHTDDLVYGMNEWDTFAVEEAIRLREEHGGTVTAVTIGNDEAEDVLRRALAMGADHALHLHDEAFEWSDPEGIARILHAALSARPFDLILAGSVSADAGAGQVGGTLAAMLDIPQVALATAITIGDGHALVRHEVEGGLEREVEIDLPALISVQTGINEPRYVSIRGIRKVSRVDIPVLTADDIGLSPEQVGVEGSAVVLEELFLPPAGKAGEILEGDADEMADMLVERLKQHGVV
jgi:electron transfer flavoprotein beta subunit